MNRPVVFEPAETYGESLVDRVIEQIRYDLSVGDATAVYDLLKNHVSENDLEAFLPEEELAELKSKWLVS